MKTERTPKKDKMKNPSSIDGSADPTYHSTSDLEGVSVVQNAGDNPLYHEGARQALPKSLGVLRPAAGVSPGRESNHYDDTRVTKLPGCKTTRVSDIYENSSSKRLGNTTSRLNRLVPPRPVQEKRVSEFQYDYVDPASLR